MRLVANGWARMSGSEMVIIDNFINEMLGKRPNTNEERPSLYAEAKHVQNHKK
jgi:hypothetical protein